MKPTYEELEQRLIESERYGRQTDITIDNLEMKLAQMAAENAGLKAFGDKLNEMYDDLNGEGTGWQGRAEVVCQQEAIGAVMEEFDAIKTPATDAFLAEVRAQGVEMFASVLESRGRHQDYVEIANAYAAQIRKGVQS